MAWILDGKHFGGYTYEHWFDDDTAPDTGEDSGAETKTTAESGGAEGESSLQEDTGRRNS
jgi:hypothetical protein